MRKILQEKNFAKNFHIFQSNMAHFDDWKSIDIPQFDNMVHPNQLFQLCAIIGGTLLRQMQEITVFYGDCGKVTMCRIIQALTKKRGIETLQKRQDSHIQDMQNEIGICYLLEGFPDYFAKILNGNLVEWYPMWKSEKESVYWYFPTFVCSQARISSRNVYNIAMKSPETKNPDFLTSIPLDLVERKCLLAYQKFRSMLSNPNLELLEKIDAEANRVKLEAQVL
jgi:hypothetical protein